MKLSMFLIVLSFATLLPLVMAEDDDAGFFSGIFSFIFGIIVDTFILPAIDLFGLTSYLNPILEEFVGVLIPISVGVVSSLEESSAEYGSCGSGDYAAEFTVEQISEVLNPSFDGFESQGDSEIELSLSFDIKFDGIYDFELSFGKIVVALTDGSQTSPSCDGSFSGDFVTEKIVIKGSVALYAQADGDGICINSGTGLDKIDSISVGVVTSSMVSDGTSTVTDGINAFLEGQVDELISVALPIAELNAVLADQFPLCF